MGEQESTFNIEELFFSKTNQKGIIEAGNAVFVRVSEYTEEELLKRPHNIIRHEDMPRSVFKLFWTFLKEGRPIAAYVKNKSKNGKYYWVFAMAFPMQDGYLSIRLKPTSELFYKVQTLYQDVLALEAQGASLDDGVALILQVLQTLGFSSYEDFMRMALVEEILSRDTLMEAADASAQKSHQAEGSILELIRVVDACTLLTRQSFAKTRSLFDKMSLLLNDSQTILKTCHDVKFVTLNLTLASAKLGEIGRPLSVVSHNLEKLTRDISQSVGQFEEIFKVYEKSIFDMCSSIATSRFQVEMMKHLSGELTEGQEQNLCSHCALLFKLISTNSKDVQSTSTELVRTIKSMLISIEALSKVTNGMGVIHVVGKIEMARTGSSSESLASRLKEMEELTEVFKKTLKSLESEFAVGMEICDELVVHNDIITNHLKKIEEFL